MTWFWDDTSRQPGRWEPTGTREANNCAYKVRAKCKLGRTTCGQTNRHSSLLPLGSSIARATATSSSMMFRLRIGHNENGTCELPMLSQRRLSPRLPFPLSGGKPTCKSWFHQQLCFLSYCCFPSEDTCPSPQVLKFPHHLIFSWVLPGELGLSQLLLVRNRSGTHKEAPFPLHYVFSCCHLKRESQ